MEVAGSTRRYAMRGLIALALLLVYLTPLVLFYYEGETAPVHETAGTDMTLALRITVVELSKDQVTFQIMPTAGPLLGRNGRLSKDVTVETDPGTGPISHVFKADVPLIPWTIVSAADAGDILEFPFDSYEVDFDIEAQSEGRHLKINSAITHIPHGLRAKHMESQLADGGTNVVIKIARSGTILLVAALAMLSLLLVTCSACLVAWHVVYRGRKIEFSMMIWVAALLFVIPTVRNSLPGGVPPGALIDFVLFFWLQVAAVAAMASLVLTWVRRNS